MSINVTEKYRCNCAPHTGVMCMFHYKMISECADLELVSKVEKLEQEIERLREALYEIKVNGNYPDSNIARKALERGEG